MVLLLSSVDLHGHHTAGALLALDAIDRLQQVKSANIKIPTVIDGSEFVLTDPPTYPGNRLAEVLTNVTAVEFDSNLQWKVNNLSFLNYQTVRFWMVTEHKSQGGLAIELLTEYDRDNEQYFYFVIHERHDNKARLSMSENLFTELANLHQDDMSNAFHDSYTIFG